MTGYQSKKNMAQDKLAQPEQKPDEWFEGAHWSDCAVHNEPAYPKGECDCGGYTPPAAQRTEPPDWFPAVENILKVYGLQAISFVADFKEAMKDAEQSQRTWVGLTNEDVYEFAKAQLSWDELLIAAETKLKEKNT
jgi:hypothetical protein